MKNKIKSCFTMIAIMLSFATYSQTDNNSVFNKLKSSIVNNDVVYTDKSSATTTGVKAFYISLIKPYNGMPYLMVRVQYAGSSPIGFYGFNVITDKHSEYNVIPPTYKIQHPYQQYAYDYRGWCDLIVEEKFLNVLRGIINAENPKLEYFGTKDNLVRKIDKREVEAISNILEAYDFLRR